MLEFPALDGPRPGEDGSRKSDTACDKFRPWPDPSQKAASKAKTIYCWCGWHFELHGLREPKPAAKSCGCVQGRKDDYVYAFLRKLVSGQAIPLADFDSSHQPDSRIYIHPEAVIRYYDAPVGTTRHLDALASPAYGDEEYALIDHAVAAGHAHCTAEGQIRKALLVAEKELQALAAGEFRERYPRLQARLAAAVHDEIRQLLKEWDALRAEPPQQQYQVQWEQEPGQDEHQPETITAPDAITAALTLAAASNSTGMPLGRDQALEDEVRVTGPEGERRFRVRSWQDPRSEAEEIRQRPE